MPRYDAIVVGAGPAGSTAAYRLARPARGAPARPGAVPARQAVRRRAHDPRAAAAARSRSSPVVEHVVDRMELRLGHGRGFERAAGAGRSSLMTQRRRLDQYLAEQAAAAGAEFRDGVRGRRRASGTCGRRPTASAVEASVVIGADGANGIIARSLGLGRWTRPASRFEGNAPYGRSRASATPGGSWSSSGRSRAATAGSSRRATTSTSASAAGRPRGRGCASTSRALCAGTGSTPTRSRACAGTGCRCAAPGSCARARAGAPRRRRRRARRPALRRRDVRGVRQRAARRRGGARRARRATPRRSSRTPSGSTAALGPLAGASWGAKARARPLPAARRSRSHGRRSSGRGRRAPRARRPQRARRGARARPGCRSEAIAALGAPRRPPAA